MKKIKISLFWIFFIVFLLSGCSKSKILRIEDSNYCFNEKSFERVYEVNELINAFNIEIVFPDGINKNDIETGSLLVFVEKEDGQEEEFILDSNNIESYSYFSFKDFEDKTISRLTYNEIDMKNYVIIKKIKVIVYEKFNFPSPAVLNINNLNTALIFEK